MNETDKNKLTDITEKELEKIEAKKQFTMVIPRCCLEGWPTCPHVPKRNKNVKKNVGM